MALRHDIRRGALCMLAAHALFTAMGVIVKHLADHIPVIELMFFRSAFALPVILAICARSGGATLRTRRLPAAMRCAPAPASRRRRWASSRCRCCRSPSRRRSATPSRCSSRSSPSPFSARRSGIHRWSAVVLGFCGVLLIAPGQGVGFGRDAAGAAAGHRGGRRAGHVLGGDHHAGAAAIRHRELHRPSRSGNRC